MNKHNNSLGKRSTNTASLSNAISSIKSSISPVIRTGRISGHPKPLKANDEMWIPRTVRFFLTTTSTTDNLVSPAISRIFTEAGITGQIRVLGIKVWNFTNQNNTSNYIQVTSAIGLTETAVSTTVQDIGNAMHLPGVHVRIPRTIASNLVTSTTTGSLFVAQGVPSGQAQVASITSQQLVADVHFEYKTDSSN